MAGNTLISTIITAYTAERLQDIYALLDSIQKQTYRQMETIFVVEGSAELLGKVQSYVAQQGIHNLKVLFNTGEHGLSAARNVGIEQAAGDIVAFVDDDVVLSSDWAENMVKAFSDESIIGVTGPAIPLWEDDSMGWFPEEFYWIISCTAWDADNVTKEVRNAWGMNMAFKREAFEKAGVFNNDFGFHKGIMAEDNEFSLRIKAATGKKIIYDPGIKLWHRVHKYRLGGKFIRERAYWIGYSRRKMKQAVGAKARNGSDLLSQEHRLLRRIATGVVPDIIGKLFTKPGVAWNITRVSVTAVTYVALGYYSHLVPRNKNK